MGIADSELSIRDSYGLNAVPVEEMHPYFYPLKNVNGVKYCTEILIKLVVSKEFLKKELFTYAFDKRGGISRWSTLSYNMRL